MKRLRIVTAIVGSILAMLFTAVGVLGSWMYFASRSVGLYMDIQLGAVRLEGERLLATFGILLILAAVFGVFGVRVLSSRKDGSISWVRMSAVCVALLAGSAACFIVLGGIFLSD